jgi:hypothetical protein
MRMNTFVFYFNFTLLCLHCFSKAEDILNCLTDTYCQSQSPKSICKDGKCTNPFEDSCLLSVKDLVENSPYKKRVCTSLDKGNTDHCEPNIFDYPEIRLYPGNWESSMFTSWLAQIYLSEVLRVPVTIETGSKDKHFDFYDPNNAFDYPSSSYHWEALKTANSVEGGVCPQSAASKQVKTTSRRTETDSVYKPCAHGMLEVWPSGNQAHLNTMIKEDSGEIAGSIGGYGKISWYTFERVIADDPTLKSFYGFQNRTKLANLYKRPISWGEYCNTLQLGTCNSNDNYATRKPKTTAEEQMYYVKDLYKGYFKADNCFTNSNCNGYVINAPCDWSTFMDAQIRWSLPSGEKMALTTDGPREDGGYSYGQMQQIFEAAGLQNENILIWWWEPESLTEKWRVDPKWKLTSIILPDFTKECNLRRPTMSEKCSASPLQRQGLQSASGCNNPIELLSKVFSKGLREQLLSWKNLSRSSTGTSIILFMFVFSQQYFHS